MAFRNFPSFWSIVGHFLDHLSLGTRAKFNRAWKTLNIGCIHFQFRQLTLIKNVPVRHFRPMKCWYESFSLALLIKELVSFQNEVLHCAEPVRCDCRFLPQGECNLKSPQWIISQSRTHSLLNIIERLLEWIRIIFRRFVPLSITWKYLKTMMQSISISWKLWIDSTVWFNNICFTWCDPNYFGKLNFYYTTIISDIWRAVIDFSSFCCEPASLDLGVTEATFHLWHSLWRRAVATHGDDQLSFVSLLSGLIILRYNGNFVVCWCHCPIELSLHSLSYQYLHRRFFIRINISHLSNKMPFICRFL